VTEVTSALVTRDTPPRGPRGGRYACEVVKPFGVREREREVNQVAEKKITPKKATKSTAKRASTEAATRVTKRKQKRMRKAAK
jgi:hypothetical protein